MNRHECRRADKIARENRFYRDYVRHLPRIPINAPYERGRLYHTVLPRRLVPYLQWRRL